MLVLDYPCIRLRVRGIVDDRVALIIVGRQHLGFEPQGAVLKLAEDVAEKPVRRARVNNLRGLPRKLRLIFAKIATKLYRTAFEQLFDKLRIAADGYALIFVGKIIVVVGEAQRQTLYYKCGQIAAVPAPLLFGIFLDKLVINVRADHTQRLLFEVLRRGNARLLHLLIDDCTRLRGGCDAPHFGKRVHIEGQIVRLAAVHGNGGIDIIVELRKACDVVPDALIRGVEDVRAVAMDGNALHLFRINVSADMRALVYDEAFFAFFDCLMRENRAEKPRADN